VNIPQLVRERVGIDLQEVAGTRLAGEIPLTDEAVNRLLAQRLQNHPQIAGLRVQAQENDVVAIQALPRMRLMPPMRIQARIERQPQLPHDPRLMLRWSLPAAGPLAFFAAPVLSYFKALPPGIAMDGDRIAVDLRTLLRGRGLEDTLSFVREVAVHTRPGAFVVSFALEIGKRDTGESR
jgi:hypothetical protein